MSDRAGSLTDSADGSKAREGSADALKASVDLSLVAERPSSNRAHNKTTVEPEKLPLSGEARERAERLAAQLGSTHSG